MTCELSSGFNFFSFQSVFLIKKMRIPFMIASIHFFPRYLILAWRWRRIATWSCSTERVRQSPLNTANEDDARVLVCQNSIYFMRLRGSRKTIVVMVVKDLAGGVRFQDRPSGWQKCCKWGRCWSSLVNSGQIRAFTLFTSIQPVKWARTLSRKWRKDDPTRWTEATCHAWPISLVVSALLNPVPSIGGLCYVRRESNTASPHGRRHSHS